MSATLRFTDYNDTFAVDYKTNLINETDDNFTVIGIVGLDDAEVVLGMQFKELAYSVGAFKAFAITKGLKLSKINDQTQQITVIQDFTGGTYYGGGLGIDNI